MNRFGGGPGTRALLAPLACAAILGCAATGAPPPRVPAPTAAERAAPDLARSTLYEVFVRDFSPGGDFRGVADGLDRIAAVGADIVWLMPIHPIGERERKGGLGSPYSVRDYHALNPDFGDADDFRALVRAVHDRGLRLIIDWVPNHTAWDHPWVTRHPEFYTRDAAGAMTVPRDTEGNLTDWTDVVELDFANPGLRRAMIDAMRYWVEEFDIDGFRVDVAGMVPDEFWREAIPELRAIKPLVLLAEWDDPRMHHLGFDLTYAWPSYHRLKEVWRGGAALAFVEAELAELRGLPPGGMRLRFTTNHDETAWDAPPVELFGGSAGARAAFVAMALLPGPPLIYNGQEVESLQRLPLFEREPVDWDVAGAREARAFYHRVIELARGHPAFAGEPLEAVPTDAEEDVIAYRRGDVIVLVNVRPRPVSVSLRDADPAGASELLTGGVHRSGPVELPAYAAVVLELAAARSSAAIRRVLRRRRVETAAPALR